jgi:predicted acyltransferase
MMIAVAIAALASVAFKGEGNPVAGALIVGSCVAILAGKLASDAIAQERASGRKIGPGRKVGISLVSATLAVGTIGLADFTFLFVWGFFASMNPGRYWISAFDVVAGGLAAVGVATCLRLAIRSMTDTPAPSRATDGLPDEIKPDEWV